MSFRKPASGVIFANKSLENDFNSMPNNNWLKKALIKSIADLKEDAFSGESIPKRLIPIFYIKKYNVDNLWWYSLPNAWRLIYMVITPSNKELLVSILEYFDHKNYGRRFKY